MTPTSTQSTVEPELLVTREGSVGLIVLNRPKALNSLTLAMVRGMEAALDEFEHDPDVVVVLVSGAGERGLCAGGDIRMIYDSGRAGDGLAELFWREEYILNARIARFVKPYIAQMDGIVMGGGVGISAHGSHRVVTDTTRLAMPETGIGFFPDVGASWLLSRGQSELGTYLGLTGTPVGAADAITAGLADYHVPRDNLPLLLARLESVPRGSRPDKITTTIGAAGRPAGPGLSLEDIATIENTFRFDAVEQILSALDDAAGDFARTTAAVLRTKSPLSLKVTLRLLRLGRQSSTLEQCLEQEFAATRQILQTPDFYEGIRAAVIDKDRNPKWASAALSDIQQADVDAFFVPHPRPLFNA